MKQIGEQLRQKRKELNLSLKEIENATSIRMAYLHSLEEGEIDKIISPIYAQGFFEQYASFLALDAKQIIKENPNLFNKAESQEFAYGIGTLEVRNNPGSGVKWFPGVIWIIVLIGILTVAWYTAKFLGVV